MTRFLLYSLLLLLSFSWLQCNRLPQAFEPEPVSPEFQRGMTLACWSEDCFSDSNVQKSLQQLQLTGSDWVSIVITAYQSKTDDNFIQLPFSAPGAPVDESLIHTIEYARVRGFKIMLKPHVDVRDGTWRGKINPQNRAIWFKNYTAYILRYSRLAQKYGIDQFVVGTELVRLSRETDRWLKLIQSVRRTYSGKLLYAASWNEYESIAFWSALDYAGINAFFPLTNIKNPAMIDLLAGWEFWINKIQAWQSHIQKAVIFTEIGYTSRDGTNIHPFKFDSDEKIDLQEQADCYAAALQVFPKLKWLAGAYWWYWRTDLMGGPDNGDYSPFAKPAEEILRRAWNGASL